MTAVRFLTSDDIAELASPAEYVSAVRNGYRERGNGAPAEPRTRLDSADPLGFLTGYFAILPEMGAMGGYTYAAGFGHRDAQFVLPLFDAESGELLAILDGASMNPSKTGATGGVGVDELARSDATEVGLVGSGTQARGQLLATATVRNLDHVAVYSPTESNREEFAVRMDSHLDVNVDAVDSSEAAVSGADIVITAMGQYHPEKHEIDAETVARAKYVPDLRARIESDAGAYRNALETGAIEVDHVHGELGDVVANEVPGRETDEEITLFDSGGTAIETVAAAKLLYDRAVDQNLGKMIEFSPASEAFPGR